MNSSSQHNNLSHGAIPFPTLRPISKFVKFSRSSQWEPTSFTIPPQDGTLSCVCEPKVYVCVNLNTFRRPSTLHSRTAGCTDRRRRQHPSVGGKTFSIATNFVSHHTRALELYSHAHTYVGERYAGSAAHCTGGTTIAFRVWRE